MPIKLNTYSIPAITKAVQQMPLEQKNSMETYLLTHTDRTIPNSQTLNTLLTTHFPGASLLISDPQVREIRRSLSEIAWQTMLLQVAADAAIDRPAEAKPYLYGLFRPESNPDNQLFNNELRQAIEDHDTQALANLYDAHLQGLEPYTAEDLQDLTDEKLVENFSKLYSLYMAAQDAAQLLAAGTPDDTYSHLSNDSRELLKTLNKDLPLFAALISRFEMICHPCYELVDTAGLMAHSNVAVQAGNAVRALPQDSQDAWFFQQAQTQADHHFDLQLVRQLEKSQIDLSTAKIYDLQQNEYHLNAPSGNRCGEALRQGKPLICRDAQGHLMALRPEKGQFVQSHPQSLVDSAAYAFFTTEMNQLVEQATGSTANPFWMLTGSSQYKNLKTALKQHAQLVKTIGYPPNDQSMATLNDSLDQLSKAATDYLTYKDPSITGDMTFQRYMQENKKARGMNAREKARLEAAFRLRDLAPRTHYIVSLSREISIQKEPEIPADRVFYQALLRKYDGMQKQLDRYLSNSKRRAAVANTLDDPNFYDNKSGDRPEGMDNVNTLLWEMQQMTELINNTENLMGLNPQERILDKKEADRMRIAKKSGEQDPATLSVEALKSQLAAMSQDALLERAKTQAENLSPKPEEVPTPAEAPIPAEAPKPTESQEPVEMPPLMEILQLQDVLSPKETPLPQKTTPNMQAQGDAPEQQTQDQPEEHQEADDDDLEEEQPDVPRTLDYKPVEFYYAHNMPILLSNSSAEVKAYLNDNPDTPPTVQQHLDHRMKGLRRFEKLEANNPSHRPTSSYTAMRNGKPVEGEPMLGDTIMLPGVHERRAQSTGNGCWSVSLCSQFEYRGINLAQEEIRTHRPSTFEANDDLDRYCKNETQTLSDYSGLVSRMLPNSCLFQFTFSHMDDREVSIARLKNMIFQILTKENSPVSVCRLGHYVTVVGMDENHVYLKNPSPNNGDPENIEKWSFSKLLSGGQVELNWVSDLTPSLGGSIEPDTSWCTDGIFYGNGRAYSSIREEAYDPIDPKEKVVKSHFSWEFPNAAPDGSTLKCPATVIQPLHLKYTRLPGSNYNADVLKTMQQQLQPLRDLHPAAVDAVLQTAEKLQQGVYKENPDAGMLALAGNYMAALKQLKQQPNDPAIQPLQQMLTDHLSKVRTAVMDMQTAQYKHLIGPPSQYMTRGNEETCPEGYYPKIYDMRRQAYFDLKQGFAGMVYFHTVNSFALDDERWLKCLKPQACEAAIAKIKDSAGFNNMIEEMYDQAKKFDYYTGSDFRDRKAFLEQKMGKRSYDDNDMLITNIPNQPDLENISADEARQKLQELMDEKKQFFLDNGINPAYYDRKPPQYDAQRTEIEYRIKCFADLRASARSGNTAPLYNLCLQHINKVAAKDPQGNQPKQPENAAPENAAPQNEAQVQAGMVNL